MYTIIKTSNAFTRPKYKPRSAHNMYGVYDCTNKKTIARNITAASARKLIDDLRKD